MAYVLSRALIVLFGWGITCGLISKVWSNADPMIFYVAGASWVLAGIIGFGYMHRLRREFEDHRSGV